MTLYRNNVRPVPGLLPIDCGIVHIVRKGARSFCGEASLEKGGWLVPVGVVQKEDQWQRNGFALCVTCLRLMVRWPALGNPAGLVIMAEAMRLDRPHGETYAQLRNRVLAVLLGRASASGGLPGHDPMCCCFSCACHRNRPGV